MTSLVPRPEDACAFLDLLYPDTHRVLVSINPLSEKGREEIEATTTIPGDDLAVSRFMEKAAARKWNVYYSVNLTVGLMRKKPKRSDLASIPYLHVDVDPRKAIDDDERADMPAFLAKERKRILDLFDKQPNGVPLPTAIVFSGGGYNGLWKLEEPLVITGTTDQERLKSADDQKHYNRWIEQSFKADNCHNLDRVLRLPGSINFPNAVKIRAGRTEPTQAALLSWHADRVYPISAFQRAPISRGQASGPPPLLRPPEGPIPRQADVADLNLERIPKTADLVRRVIVDGRDAQDPTRFTEPGTGKFDRSRAVYFVSKQLAKAWKDAPGADGQPMTDEMVKDKIYGILTDPKYGISESILEKGQGQERAALRSVERGLDGAVSDELEELNGRHAVILSFGGECVVVQEEVGTNGRSRLTVSSFDSVKRMYCNRQLRVGTKPTKGGEVEVFQDLGTHWLQHPNRRQYKGVVFSPGRETPGYYNLWQGFAVDAIEGDCGLFLDHLRAVVCDGNDEYYEYLLSWMACAVQHPDEPGHVAVVFRGAPGAGKGVVAREFGKLFGRHYLTVINSTHVVGQFNEHLRDCVLLFLDEAFFAGDVKHKSVLKALVTEPEIMIEKKRYDAVLSANHLHVMMASNESWVVPADAQDRRYFVLDVPSHRRGMNHEQYWQALYKQMDEGGREALLWMLKQRDISKFNPRKFPETAALAAQKLLSMSSLQEWWYRKLLEGQLHPTHVEWSAPMPFERLVDNYLLYGGKLRSRISVGTEVGRFLGKMAPGATIKKENITDRTERGDFKARYRCYRMPSLASCREIWDREFGSITDWPEDDVVDPVPVGGGF